MVVLCSVSCFKRLSENISIEIALLLPPWAYSLAAGHAEAISVERLEQELTPKAKRRRVMVDPWEEILAEMSHNQLDEQELLPWLQVG